MSFYEITTESTTTKTTTTSTTTTTTTATATTTYYSAEESSYFQVYNLLNETSLVHNILSIFRQFFYNFYTFRTSPGSSSGGITVFMRHLVLCYSV